MSTFTVEWWSFFAGFGAAFLSMVVLVSFANLAS